MRRLITLSALFTLIIYIIMKQCGPLNSPARASVSSSVSVMPLIQRPVVKMNDWETFRKALIMVESEGNPNAENKRTKAYGLYQILPKGGYLSQYNKLKGTDYTVSDLVDVNLQHEIFNVIQEWGNPEKDFKKALTIHNPRAMNKNYMTDYEYRVMYWYYKIEYDKLVKKYNNL